ncbi:MAG: VCBS repeat-containing protein [Phycisphaerales bacterium]|nr:VCBS repeat-containing protein [Phycisphaerales bacterium]
MIHPVRLVRILLLLEAVAVVGAGCGGSPHPANHALITACGLLASECVPLDGASPVALFAGDLNGNLALDLVVANFSRANVTTLFNNGDASFTIGNNAQVGDTPLSIAGGDWDGDGDLDLVVTAGFRLALLFNRGDGSFEPAVEMYLGWPPWAVAAADLDNDGDLDLVAVNGIGDDIWILYNDGQGFFTVETLKLNDPDAKLHGVAIGDFDNNGRVDIAVAQEYDKILLLTGGESEQFVVTKELSVGPTRALSALAVPDVNNDAWADLIVTVSGDRNDPADPGEVVILCNNAGDFGPASALPAGRYPLSVATGDFDQDGLVDLAVANNLSDDVSIFFNQSNAIFASPRHISVGDGPSFIIAEDLDGDGVVDLAVANMNSDSISILINDGTGQFIPEGQ